MNRLSSAPTALQPHYDVVVVGSGYGGAIAASRMARAGRSVCVLERGREFMAGEFPRTPFQGTENIQYNTALAQIGSPLALLEVHVNEDVNAVVGCGLGGTSLINANVALEADPRLWTTHAGPPHCAPTRTVETTAVRSPERCCNRLLYPTIFRRCRNCRRWKNRRTPWE